MCNTINYFQQWWKYNILGNEVPLHLIKYCNVGGDNIPDDLTHKNGSYLKGHLSTVLVAVK